MVFALHVNREQQKTTTERERERENKCDTSPNRFVRTEIRIQVGLIDAGIKYKYFIERSTVD